MAVVCAKSASFATHPVAVLLSGTCAPTRKQSSPDFESSSKVELTSWGGSVPSAAGVGIAKTARSGHGTGCGTED